VDPEKADEELGRSAQEDQQKATQRSVTVLWVMCLGLMVTGAVADVTSLWWGGLAGILLCLPYLPNDRQIKRLFKRKK